MRVILSLLIGLVLCLWSLTSWAAIGVSHLTNAANSTDANSYTTASITPTANACVILSVASRMSTSPSGGPNVPTATGNGLTYVEVLTRSAGLNEASSTNSRITIFRAMGAAPTAGAITIDFAGETQTHAAWSVTEFTGTDTGGTHCSGAIVQSASTNGTIAGSSASPATVTLASPPASTGNLTYGWVRHFVNATVTPGSGFTQLSHNTESGDGAGYLAEYKLNEQTASATFAGSGWIIAAFELKEAVAAATLLPSSRGACMVLGVRGC